MRGCRSIETRIESYSVATVKGLSLLIFCLFFGGLLFTLTLFVLDIFVIDAHGLVNLSTKSRLVRGAVESQYVYM
jgi:hypothetical protein